MLRSWPEPSPICTSTPALRMNKRKLPPIDDDDDESEAFDQPRKLPAIGTNTSSHPEPTSRKKPRLLSGLTKPVPPNLTVPRRSTRATSAPPKSSSATLRSGRRRVASGSTRTTETLRDLQNQVTSLGSAQASNALRIAQHLDAERTKVAEIQADHHALYHELASSREAELDKRRQLVDSTEQLEQLRLKHAKEVSEFEIQLQKRTNEIRQLSEDLRGTKADLGRERTNVTSLKSMISNQSAAQISLNAQMNALQTERDALQAQLDTVTSTASEQNLDHQSALRRIAFLEQEAREAEMVRRKLHNMVQELKGNIRVFCRVRPVLPRELASPATGGTRSGPSSNGSANPEDLAKTLVADIGFPDKRDYKEIVLTSTSSSAMGQERKEVYAFSFDRVFEPESTQCDVFEEISLLAQSCVDGYNVCIFAYGQTGSGKSFTMEGGSTEATVGMIPRAVNEVFKAADTLRSKGWQYTMEGQFLEIYNETINDLLGKGEFDKKKHEIKHEKTATNASTRVTDVNVMPLRTPREVSALLRLANSRRTVAATLMNERSSRSHSVFTLRISGCNEHTGERCEGSLNLVDLAGSERLNSSGAAGVKERLKETQNINRSLSALGDVIAALGEKGEKGEKHIPYRNSKLTYLLQHSLSGHSKTLMILNLSPLAAHFNESLTSLRFATKVNNTTVGPAKRQVRGAG
ncbi:P-loop containing nucleoside triphosphate hydrolase protein [Boletus edulis BED1]|uniref:Kinesin-like protein n=1 Tax=Boletus edulis BED1 TaxID=1328754 RepID=A0AAD4GKH8_BOLED|nr:P-loop containing nucleoside triphosphate hydrolase protein [Boletus edulis BED1]